MTDGAECEASGANRLAGISLSENINQMEGGLRPERGSMVIFAGISKSHQKEDGLKVPGY
jgi:hypothetical protein